MPIEAVEHVLLRTDRGVFLASVDSAGVVVCPRALSSETLLAVREAVEQGGIYIVAFASHPGQICALDLRHENGERVQRQISRQAATAEIGMDLLDLCSDIADTLARQRFAAWKQHEEEQIAALRAVLTTSTPGEA